MRLIYETHSTSTDNEIGVASGQNDPDLSATGERQAFDLGERDAAGALEEVVIAGNSKINAVRGNDYQQ